MVLTFDNLKHNPLDSITHSALNLLAMRPPHILSLLLAATTLLLVTSCSTSADTERLARIGDLALSYAERSGQITPQEAALAREAGKLVLSNDAPSQPPVAPVEAK